MIGVRIEAPHFVAGVELVNAIVEIAAPILRYTVGWTFLQLVDYCQKKQWKWQFVGVLSVSQLNEFLLCPRRWGFSYLDGLKGEMTHSLLIGLRLHSIQENWLKYGKMPDAHEVMEFNLPTGILRALVGQLAVLAHHLLPMPGQCFVEGQYYLETPNTVWRGFKDIVDLTTDPICLSDHKCTGNFKWQKTPDDLLTDPQAVIYSADCMSRYNVDRVKLRWIYYRYTGRPEVRHTDVVLTKEQIAPIVSLLDLRAREVNEMRRKYRSALELPVNPDACDRFGGCPYQQRCNLPLIYQLEGVTYGSCTSDLAMGRYQRPFAMA